jgi:hypothetical protein
LLKTEGGMAFCVVMVTIGIDRDTQALSLTPDDSALTGTAPIARLQSSYRHVGASGRLKDLYRNEDRCAAADVASRCVVSHDAAMKQLLPLGSVIATMLIVSRAESQANDVPFVANVQRDGDGCRFTVDGKQATSGDLLQLVAAGKYHRGIIVSRGNVTYKCIGGAVYILQRAGLSKIDFATWTAD